MDVNKTFANRFRARRKELGYNQEEIAKILGVQRATVANYERGVILPTTSNLPQIAKVLGVTVEYLLGNVDELTMKDVVNNWYKKLDGKYIVHDITQLISDLKEQIALDNEISYNKKILSENQKNIILKQLDNILDLISL